MQLTSPVFVLLVLAATAGCSPKFEPNPPSADNPASVDAQEAPHSGTSPLVVSDELLHKSEMQLARKDVPNPDFQNSQMPHNMDQMPTPAPSAIASPAGEETVGEENKKSSDRTKDSPNRPMVKPDDAKTDENIKDKSPSTPMSAVSYTCVMHPEVDLPAPGKCPKCGMTLVKKEGETK